MKTWLPLVATAIAISGCATPEHSAPTGPAKAENGIPAPAKAPLTEANARSILMEFGCSNVSGLSESSTGKWHGSCTKSGALRNVVVDEQGHASIGEAQHLTAGNARFMLMQYGCTNLGRVTGHKDGSWSAPCTKSSGTKIASVCSDGKITMR